MSLMSFLKEAGEKLLEVVHAPATLDPAAGERDLEAAIHDYLKAQGLPAEGLVLAFDASTATVTVSGKVADQATREKILLCCGNVHGVAHVTDLLELSSPPSPPSRMYTVQSGDTLSTIALHFYGDASQYRRIFDANQPMLSDPEQIYPGQMLRIPA